MKRPTSINANNITGISDSVSDSISDGISNTDSSNHRPRIKIKITQNFQKISNLLVNEKLETVCDEANCPNKHQCWSESNVTFLLLGRICTRNCAFCSVTHQRSSLDTIDPETPKKIAHIISKLQIKYAVLTSVTRDDLEDGGSSQFARTITLIREYSPLTKTEVLTPDFMGDETNIQRVLAARPDVFSHNLETVERLSTNLRDRRASYKNSLSVLKLSKEIAPSIPTKSSLMLGLGESNDELKHTFYDLSEVGCDFLTLGQYLKPSPQCVDVVRYLDDEEFNNLKDLALRCGLKSVIAGPLVRSSYNAHLLLDNFLLGEKKCYE